MHSNGAVGAVTGWVAAAGETVGALVAAVQAGGLSGPGGPGHDELS
jgi:hypothetical protein